MDWGVSTNWGLCLLTLGNQAAAIAGSLGLCYRHGGTGGNIGGIRGAPRCMAQRAVRTAVGRQVPTSSASSARDVHGSQGCMPSASLTSVRGPADSVLRWAAERDIDRTATARDSRASCDPTVCSPSAPLRPAPQCDRLCYGLSGPLLDTSSRCPGHSGQSSRCRGVAVRTFANTIGRPWQLFKAT